MVGYSCLVKPLDNDDRNCQLLVGGAGSQLGDQHLPQQHLLTESLKYAKDNIRYAKPIGHNYNTKAWQVNVAKSDCHHV